MSVIPLRCCPGTATVPDRIEQCGRVDPAAREQAGDTRSPLAAHSSPSGAVVRGFARDGDVMGVGLTEPGPGDLHELGLGAGGVDRTNAAVPHPAPEPADQLEE